MPNIELWTKAQGTHVEWALVLKRVDESDSRFKRIGLAITYVEGASGEYGRVKIV
jgi:hypothetical protein